MRTGAEVSAGQVLGTVSTVDGGTVIETFTAPAGGVILFVTSSPAVAADGLLLGLGAAVGLSPLIHDHERKARAYSWGRRNGLVFGQEPIEFLPGGVPAEAFAGPVVEFVFDFLQLGGGVRAEVGALGEVFAQQPVDVLVAAALPGRVRVGEVDAGRRFRR